jgi:hypothetical protein
MDSKTYTLQMGQARNQLRRLEHDWVWGKRNFNNAIHNCIVGGIILLIGLLALIEFLVKGNQFGIVMAAASLSIGSLTFIMARVTTGAARGSVNTLRAWQRIASYAGGSESGKMQEVIFYEPLQMESPTPNRVDRTRSATDYCGISCSQAAAEKRTALGVGILDIRSIE